MGILFSIIFFSIAIVLFINRPIRNEEKSEKESEFKVNLGRGIESVTYDRLSNLTNNEKDLVFKNAKQCTHLKNLPENINWDTTNMTAVVSFNSVNENQIKYCYDND